MNYADIPIVETQRLRLRAHRRSDLSACLAMWSDPNVTRFISGKPSTEQQTWARMLGYVGHWAFMGFGCWVIAERETNEFVGEVGLSDFRRDIEPSMRAVPELGFVLASRFHRKGYATEAARAAVEWADANLPYERTVCLVNAENHASLRVAEKCGYTIFEHATFNEQPALFLSRGAWAP